MSTKFYIGPMTKNIVDAVIELNNENNKCLIGFIPSRRQIEYDGGYVNNWTTKQFCDYVKNKSSLTLIKRDHGGEGQGKQYDDGLESYRNDIINNFDYIHIDPWKKSSNIQEAVNKTVSNILFCLQKNKDIKFEVGTEQAIFEYSAEELQYFLTELKNQLKDSFSSIHYAVVQGGTKIKDTINLGNYDREKMSKMCNIVKNFGLLSKEHNGDYLTRESIFDRFANGLDAINIAPEFGVLETKFLLNHLDANTFEKFFEICYHSKKWEKWVSKDFDFSNKKLLVEICGHYNINVDIIKEFKNKNVNFDESCKKEIKQFIKGKLL